MRPINLIPQEERRSHGTTTRTGPLAYILVGSLAVLLIGVVMLVLTSNQISDRKDEVTSLEAQKARAAALADRLAPYASFHQVAEQRTQTITSLADSRFDWSRVIRELSLILPQQVYFTGLTASAGGSESSAVGGTALTLTGCAPGQNAVAGFVASLKQVDGVTRVGLNSSSLSGRSEGGEEAAGADFCSTGGKAQFVILVAFDSAPPSPDSGEASVAPLGEESAEAPEGEAGAEGATSSEGESESATPAEPEAESAGGETAASATSGEPAG